MVTDSAARIQFLVGKGLVVFYVFILGTLTPAGLSVWIADVFSLFVTGLFGLAK